MKIRILSFLLLISQFYFPQNLIQVDIEGKKLDYFIKLENKLGSKIYKTDEEYTSIKPVTAPVIFERKEKEIPNLRVFYTLYKKDSTIAEILYEWDIRNFEKGYNVKKSLSFNKAMIKKYQEIVDEVSKKYGNSKHDGNLDKLDLLTSEGIDRRDNWEINKNLKIYSYIGLSEHYESNGMVTTSPTHRIRLYVTNEKEGKDASGGVVSAEKIKSFNDKFLQLVDKLKVSDFNEARNFLSERIRTSATNDILEKLVENAHFENNLEVFMTGYQLIPDGNQYPMLQYKYVDDTSVPPKEIITVIFEEDGKVLGIKPVKRLN
jgi:hypothetical protein